MYLDQSNKNIEEIVFEFADPKDMAKLKDAIVAIRDNAIRQTIEEFGKGVATMNAHIERHLTPVKSQSNISEQ